MCRCPKRSLTFTISTLASRSRVAVVARVRPRLGPRSQRLADRPLEPSALYLLLQHYLEQLPGAMKEEKLADGSPVRRCIYTPHSLRATTATLLLDANVDIVKVKDLLGHRHITTTQIYVKRRRSTSESARHLLAIYNWSTVASLTGLLSSRGSTLGSGGEVLVLPPKVTRVILLFHRGA